MQINLKKITNTPRVPAKYNSNSMKGVYDHTKAREKKKEEQLAFISPLYKLKAENKFLKMKIDNLEWEYDHK